MQRRGIICHIYWVGLCIFCQFQTACAQSASREYPAFSLSPIYPAAHPYLIKDEELYDYFSIDSSGIYLYASPHDKKIGNAEFHLYPDEFERMLKLLKFYPMEKVTDVYKEKGTNRWLASKKVYTPPLEKAFEYRNISEKPLAGLRVALDPGHLAGDHALAETEGKYMKMRASMHTKHTAIHFHESDLTIQTARIIKQKLEAEGATVMITRKRKGLSVDGFDFDTWKKVFFHSYLDEQVEKGLLSEWDRKWYKTKAKDKDIFKLYNSEDLYMRAEKINAFRPHLTMVIHYNVHAPNEKSKDKEGFFLPTHENYAMSFVPGAFLKNELRTQEDRIHFLYFLLNPDFEQSIFLSQAFIKASKEIAGVRTVSEEDKLIYLDRLCIQSSVQGVYARNLKLTRMVRSPICYGESLCQDNLIEALALNKKDTFFHDRYIPSRLLEIAETYVSSVHEFADKMLRE
ncbi:MAG: hypothetical protein AAF824_02380 [Bacteroidota bacterium]